MFLVNSYWFVPSTTYLLDTYSAAAAYSLRQLKTGVTNVVRVRRSSDNAESDFTADEITDGTLTTWTGANDGFVVTWYDQSGSGNDVTQATAGSQPQLVSSGSVLTKGSLPAAKFDGSADYLHVAGSAPSVSSFSFFSVSSSTSGGTVGAVYSSSSTSAQCIRVFHDSRTTPNRNLVIQNTSAVSYFADLSTARNDTNQRLLSSFVDSSFNMSGYDNSATGGTDTFSGSVNGGAFNIGAQYAGGYTSFMAGEIQEVIIFNSDETSNRTDIESDINTYYSIWYSLYSLSFDGVDESVNLGRVTATESASNISLSFWFKVPSLASNEPLIGRLNSGSAKQFRCNTKTGGEFAFWTRNSADTAGVECRTPASTITANTWYHAIVSYDGTQGTNAGKVKIYINGVLQTLTFSGTVRATTDNGTDNFLIGAYTASAGYCLMDEVRIYDYTLTGTDATNIYNSGSPTEETQSPVAVHKYRFEDADSSWDGSNYTFTDLGSAGSNDGTSQNMEEADRTTDRPV